MGVAVAKEQEAAAAAAATELTERGKVTGANP